jgi:dTDP-4-amino-4,6-dideoxygalactose transaminase
MSNLSFIPYARQSIDSNDVASVQSVLMSNWITRGEQVEAFEHEIASYCGAKYAVAFNSGTSALAASCYAAEVNPTDRLITTSNSFIASVGAGIRMGAKPIFVDIDLASGNFDLEQVILNANQPSSRGRAVVVPVHFAGVPVDMCRLDHKITDPNTVIIEDAAHALGSSYYSKGPKVGSCLWSAMTVFSFHPAKTITTGEGGMVTTNDEKLWHRLKLFRNNGIERDPKYLEGAPPPWYYEVRDITDNHNFTEFQAALGRSQFKRLEQFVSRRLELMKLYRDKLRHHPHIKLLTSEFNDSIAFHLCVVLIDFPSLGITRNELMQGLLAKNIGTQMHYIPLYRHPYFVKKYGEIHDYFPAMEEYYAKAISLPLYFGLTHDDVERVVSNLDSIIKITKKTKYIKCFN